MNCARRSYMICAIFVLVDSSLAAYPIDESWRRMILEREFNNLPEIFSNGHVNLAAQLGDRAGNEWPQYWPFHNTDIVRNLRRDRSNGQSAAGQSNPNQQNHNGGIRQYQQQHQRIQDDSAASTPQRL